MERFPDHKTAVLGTVTSAELALFLVWMRAVTNISGFSALPTLRISARTDAARVLALMSGSRKVTFAFSVSPGLPATVNWISSPRDTKGRSVS